MKIKLSELAGENLQYHPDDWEDVEVIEDDLINTDMEKGVQDFNCVVLRRSDEKLFQFEYSKSAQSPIEYPKFATEVELLRTEERIITKNYYKEV